MKTVQFLAKNQCYYYSDGKIIFQSYNTIVATVDEKTKDVVITEGQPQSKTTAKYLDRFLREVIGVGDYKKIDKRKI